MSTFNRLPSLTAVTFLLVYIPSLVYALSSARTAVTRHVASTYDSSDSSHLAGDWSNAKQKLRYPNCCMVSVSGLEHHLSTIQQYFCGDDAPNDLDLRMKVRVSDINGDSGGNIRDVAYEDCTKIFNAVMGGKDTYSSNLGDDREAEGIANNNHHSCILALEELARGISSLADGPLEGICTDVHIRVVIASNYQAIDPMYHTDKCPLRGYVTLAGPGTEFVNETCQPWEYAALRTLGLDGLSKGKARSLLKMAEELQFIIMKGDDYNAPMPNGMSPSITSKLWSRSSACVHRSPPAAAAKSGKRVILSLDLADGKDKQEWYEISRRRGWRSGMTQRKSHLVS